MQINEKKLEFREKLIKKFPSLKLNAALIIPRTFLFSETHFWGFFSIKKT